MNTDEHNKINLEKAAVVTLELPLLREKGVLLSVLRLDQIHPIVSGNKYFKLKYYLQEALRQQKKAIITYGGAFSNHIVATAYMANSVNLKSVGLIRGERPKLLSHTLQKAMELGMDLNFISREAYAKKHNTELINNPDNYIINEGGEGALGIKGSSEILQLVKKENYTHIACAVGTATMLKGICSGSLPTQFVLGIPVLKGFDNWRDSYVMPLQEYPGNISLFPNYHGGGYARVNDDLLTFMNNFYQQTKIPTDFVYTAKLFYAMMDLIEKNYFSPGSAVLVIHSGGLQGNGSLPAQSLDF
jgi:1-aminocyclopropane-1-carboxylate deaminase